jgi:acetylornithine/N-succinyldiaminopimelate aminotransferase
MTPDIMALAKGLGGGFPIGACLATARAASGMAPGCHGSTFGGNPLACAVANGVLDVVLADGFLEHVRAVAGRLRRELDQLAVAFPSVVQEIRGQGLLLGMRCGPSNADLSAELMARGMLAVAAGENVLRLLPPLIIEQQQIDEAIGMLHEVFQDFAGREAAQ